MTQPPLDRMFRSKEIECVNICAYDPLYQKVTYGKRSLDYLIYYFNECCIIIFITDLLLLLLMLRTILCILNECCIIIFTTSLLLLLMLRIILCIFKWMLYHYIHHKSSVVGDVADHIMRFKWMLYHHIRHKPAAVVDVAYPGTCPSVTVLSPAPVWKYDRTYWILPANKK